MIQLDVPEKKQKRVTQKKLEDFVLFRTSKTQSKIEETVKKERIQATRETVIKVE